MTIKNIFPFTAKQKDEEADEDDKVTYLSELSYKGEIPTAKILQRKREEELRKKYGIKFIGV